MKNWYDIIPPREDIRKGQLDEAVFAADLGDVAAKAAPDDYGVVPFSIIKWCPIQVTETRQTCQVFWTPDRSRCPPLPAVAAHSQLPCQRRLPPSTFIRPQPLQYSGPHRHRQTTAAASSPKHSRHFRLVRAFAETSRAPASAAPSTPTRTGTILPLPSGVNPV